MDESEGAQREQARAPCDSSADLFVCAFVWQVYSKRAFGRAAHTFLGSGSFNRPLMLINCCCARSLPPPPPPLAAAIHSAYYVNLGQLNRPLMMTPNRRAASNGLEEARYRRCAAGRAFVLTVLR